MSEAALREPANLDESNLVRRFNFLFKKVDTIAPRWVWACHPRHTPMTDQQWIELRNELAFGSDTPTDDSDYIDLDQHSD